MIPEPAPMIPELEALKWAASPAAAPPDVERVDEEALRFLLQHHGLMHRFVLRAMQERPRWCRGMFLATLRLAKRDVERGVQRQIAAMQEAARLCGPGDAPPIVFKGQAVYALTGDPRTMRPSGDVDVLAADPAAFAEFLIRQGYAGEFPHIHWDHEEATLSRQGVTVEVHRGFPLPAPALAPRPDSSGADPGGALLAGFDGPPAPTVRLRYADIREGALRGIAPGTEGLWVPEPAMLALLLCCHVHHHLVNPSLWNVTADHDKLMLRLAEVADLCAVVRHPRFSPDRLQALTERHAALPAVELAAQLAWELLHIELLPAWRPPADIPIRLALQLATDHGKALVPTTADALLMGKEGAKALRSMGFAALSRVYDRGMGSTMLRMGAEEVVTGAAPMIPKRPLAFPDGAAIPCQISAAQEGDCLTLSLRLPRASEAGRRDYRVFTVHGRFGRWHAANFRKQEIGLDEGAQDQGELESTDLEGTEAGYLLTLKFAPTAEDAVSGRQEALPVLLHLMFWDTGEGEVADPAPFTLIPLLIARPTQATSTA